MKISYSIISVSNSKERIENVNKIEKIFGYKKENIKYYNAKNNNDVLEFIQNFPEINPNSYAKNRDGGHNSRPFNRAKGEAGIWMSNMSAWKYVIDNNLEEMILFEDDCIVEEENLAYLFEKIKNNKYDVYLVGLYGEAYYFTNLGAKKMLEHAKEYFELGPFDEGVYNMTNSQKIFSNGPAGYIYQINNWSNDFLKEKNVIFLQSYFNPKEINKINSEISTSSNYENECKELKIFDFLPLEDEHENIV